MDKNRIVGMIQAINASEGVPNDVVKDGKIITGDEAQTCANEIYRLISGVNLKAGEYVLKYDGYFICKQFHPILDNSGRTRPALIIWKGDSAKAESSVATLGLSIERFRELVESYKNAKKKQYTLMATLVVVVVATAVILAQN